MESDRGGWEGAAGLSGAAEGQSGTSVPQSSAQGHEVPLVPGSSFG